MPAYYKGMPDTVIGPDEEIPWPAYTDRLDHELELGAVIGRRCKDVPAAEAEDCIFGYTIWNDMSARDVQTRELPDRHGARRRPRTGTARTCSAPAW